MASMIRTDLEFVLQQILLAEAHAAGADPVTLVPNTFAPFGLRTVDGTYNNLMPGQTDFGAADQPFPQLVDPVFPDDGDGDTMPTAPRGLVTNTDYGAPGNVADADPRIISNLIVDMTTNNPAAVSAFVDAGLGTLDEFGVLRDLDGVVIPPRHPADHSERRARRRPVGTVQLVVHVLRPVLRPRPRPGQQGRQRNGVHSAASG